MADIKEVERYKYLDQVFTPGKRQAMLKTSTTNGVLLMTRTCMVSALPKFTPLGLSQNLSRIKAHEFLDCGCGTGLVGEELQKLGYHNIDGVDLSEKSLEMARKKAVYKNLTCAVLGPHRLEGVGENSYDAIVSSGCFVCDGHLNDSVLKEWTRIVKPGGYIVIAVNARYIGLCEGDTYKMLIADKRMELVKRQSIDRFTWDHKTQQYMSGFVYSLKVLA